MKNGSCARPVCAGSYHFYSLLVCYSHKKTGCQRLRMRNLWQPVLFLPAGTAGKAAPAVCIYSLTPVM